MLRVDTSLGFLRRIRAVPRLLSSFLVISSVLLAFGCSRSEGGPLRDAIRGRLAERQGGGASEQAPAVGGLSAMSFLHQGMERSYFVHVPPGAQGRIGNAALIVLHGGQGDGESVATLSGMSAAADVAEFVALYPNSAERQWNDGRSTTRTGVDDVGFLVALVGEAQRLYGIDPNRVFVAGISNGGLMALRLACEASGSFRAFGVVSANMSADLAHSCQPAVSRPMIFLNGTTDRIMPFEGGEIRSLRALGLGAGGQVLSRNETLAFWEEANGCRGLGPMTALADRDSQDGTIVTYAAADGCQASIEVYTIEGGGHNWPGSPSSQSSRLTGNVSRDVSATQVILDSFRQYGL